MTNVSCETKVCSVTDCTEPPAPSHRYCREHRNEAMRKHRAAGKEKSTEFTRMQARVRSHTHMLVRRGLLKKLPCNECGTTENVQAHHPDYSDPRRVVWLCAYHHRALHDSLGRYADVLG